MAADEKKQVQRQDASCSAFFPGLENVQKIGTRSKVVICDPNCKAKGPSDNIIFRGNK